MKHLHVILLFAMSFFIPDTLLGNDIYYKVSDSIRIERMLAECQSGRHSEPLSLFFARKFLGVPYVGATLEVLHDERLIVNTSQLDCTTLVENVVALTICARNGSTSFSDFTDALRKIRYRGGKIDEYPSRLHYFTEWIVDNERKGVVEEINMPNPPFSAVQKLSVYYMSRNSNKYKALRGNKEYVKRIRKYEEELSGKRYSYIPQSAIHNSTLLRNAIKDGDIIAITCNKPGLDIAHLGFAVWKRDGLHLLNASMIHKKVVDEPMTLRRYLSKHPSHTGIRVIRMR